MKKLILLPNALILIFCLMMGGCSRESGKISEKPKDIISTKPCSTLFGSIMEQFPEYKNNEASQALLFDAKAEKQIVLLKESDIYVSFISEGAGYNNTFGWYAYDSAQAPENASNLDLHVIFPNVSGNILEQGDMLKISDAKFKAGMVIGFFLIVGGWENGGINYSKTTLYTDFNFNPGGQQQHILFKQKDCGDLVLAFEDRLLTDDSDADFNDIIFTVTDNRSNLEVSSIDLRTIVEM